ncbi:MAG: tyrosine-type recombinase/integrase [Deltaproteobacteria bacterium]|nr:tyrosine-type recombinase/integrase [Deltaproteobacteria bacterium]
MNHLFAGFIKRFFSHYLPVQKGLSVNTILAYRDAVKLLLCYVADTVKIPVDKLTVEDITEKRVLGFLKWRKASCSRTRRWAYLFVYIARQEPVLVTHCGQIRAIPLKRTGHQTVGYLEEKQMQAVLNAVDVNSRTGVRDKALLMLMYNTGARVSEIVALELDDLRLDDSVQIRLHGKGGKERACPLWPETATVLKDYLHQRAFKQPQSQRVFLNANGAPITRFGIRYITRKYGDTNQVGKAAKPVNPHTIRHTSAMHLLRSGNDINMVSYWLGHADINTTHIYVEIDMEMKRKMIAKAGAPKIGKNAPWQKPHVLQWLDRLAKEPQLCGVIT